VTNGVLISFGDSIQAGWATDFATAPDPGRAPFGSPSSKVLVYGRWADPDPLVRLGDLPYEGDDWVPYSPETGNWQQTGTTPAYSFAEKTAHAYGLHTVYLILLGVSGSDASPAHPNPAGSWHPSVSSGLMSRFLEHYIDPAFATPELGQGSKVYGVSASLGQNCCHSAFPDGAASTLDADLAKIFSTLSRSAHLSTHPSIVLFQNPMLPRAVPDGFVGSKVWQSRDRQKAWLRQPSSFGKALVDIDSIPLQEDDIHPTHMGALEAGNRAFYGLASASPSLLSVHMP
jgi:hypothetical protein